MMKKVMIVEDEELILQGHQHAGDGWAYTSTEDP